MFLQQLVTGISVGGIYALLATGYSLIYSLLDFSNWAHGEFAMVSAYIAIVLSSFMGMPFVLAAVGGMAGGALVSFLCERFAYRRIRRNGAPNMFLMIAAMGLSNVFQQAANLIFSGQYRSYPFKLPVSTIKVASAYIGVLDLVSLAITAVIITILVYLINKTQLDSMSAQSPATPTQPRSLASRWTAASLRCSFWLALWPAWLAFCTE